jgi:broad specificity phosphatase PhoE/ribonuclease HI
VTDVVVEADGGSRGNPGPAGYGAVVLDGETGAVLAERSESIGIATNNVAEYGGLIAGLAAAAELGAHTVHVRMDSKLVVEQMSGRWQVKNSALRDLAREAIALRSQFDEVSFEWIPRAQNTRADRLANAAMDRAAGITRPSRPARAASPAPAQAWAPPTATATRLILVRHGATAHSVDRRFSGRNALELTADGRAQAAALATRAASFGPVAAVVTSPLPRCVQTAQPIAAELGLEPVVAAEFAEVDFGTWEGMTFAEVRAADPDAMTAWLMADDVAPPGGESFADVAVRVARERDAIVAGHPGASVVVVTHVTPIKTLIRLALDAPAISMFRLHLDPASISIVDYFADGNCSVRLVNDTSHLAAVG